MLQVLDGLDVGKLAGNWRKRVKVTGKHKGVLPISLLHGRCYASMRIARLHLGRKHLLSITDQEETKRPCRERLERPQAQHDEFGRYLLLLPVWNLDQDRFRLCLLRKEEFRPLLSIKDSFKKGLNGCRCNTVGIRKQVLNGSKIST